MNLTNLELWNFYCDNITIVKYAATESCTALLPQIHWKILGNLNLKNWLWGTVPPNHTHTHWTLPSNNTHAGGTVLQNNKTLQVFASLNIAAGSKSSCTLPEVMVSPNQFSVRQQYISTELTSHNQSQENTHLDNMHGQVSG